jgi:uncharacterized cupin superfamily protein
MRPALIETGRCNMDLRPAPIEASWILEGNLEARLYVLSTSACGTAKTPGRSCTEGKFNWYYDVDETITILEGSIVLESEGMPPRRYGIGDVILFGTVRTSNGTSRPVSRGSPSSARPFLSGSVSLLAPSTSSSECSSPPACIVPRASKATWDATPARILWPHKTHNVN